jgi:hypothetical protein
VITVEALDINCPQHITQRFSLAELAELAADPDGLAMLREVLRQQSGE